ncbi:MAG: metallophosphoesterase [Phycisphaerae bacterium]|nr:metallophosphoesterase [Phycisphaerae bacterium]
MRVVRFVSAMLLFAFAALAHAADLGPATAPDQVEVVFLHINDSHGQTAGTGQRGGEARLATLVGDLRKQPGPARVFLVHCGDVISRGDDVTRKTHGAANFTLMNRLRFDAWIPGNGDIYDGLPVLQARMADARFPTLCGNVKVKATGEPLARPFIIEQAGPVKVAILGLCFFRVGAPGGDAIDFEDPIAAAKRIVPELRKRADLVVAMTHIGVDRDGELAKAVPDIDVILGGHTHTPLPNGLILRPAAGRRVLICQTAGELNSLGWASVTMKRTARGRGYEVAGLAAKLIPLDQTVKQDPEVKAFLARTNEIVATQPDPEPLPAPAGRP